MTALTDKGLLPQSIRTQIGDRLCRLDQIGKSDSTVLLFPDMVLKIQLADENGNGERQMLTWLQDNRPEEELVLSHGDFCLPNLFFDEKGVSGFLDLGRCGVADRWCDIALCYRSLCCNFRGDYGDAYPGLDEDGLFRALGVTPDWERIRYYILLDELF